jgi:hypothetical protein
MLLLMQEQNMAGHSFDLPLEKEIRTPSSKQYQMGPWWNSSALHQS